jgi:EspG family
MPAPNAVELTVEQAWFVADTVGAGQFPWVLAITPPDADTHDRSALYAAQTNALIRAGVLDQHGRVNAAVAEWIGLVCFCDRWLELRFVGPDDSGLLRGVVARRGTQTVVALRTAQLVTFTAMTVDHPEALVPIVVSGLAGRRSAEFPEFALPARVGARADERLRAGAQVTGVLEFLGVPALARPVVESVFSGPRSYVEIVAGQRRHGEHATSEVGVGVIDAAAGRILVSPSRAADGEWISTFAPGTRFNIAVAVERLTATLPEGEWFPHARLTRDLTNAT